MKTKNEKPLHKTAAPARVTRQPDPNAILDSHGQVWALPGVVCVQYTRCGKPTCRCAQGGENLHGPYYVRCYRFSGGRQVRRYVRPDEVEATRAACQEWQQLQAQLRENRQKSALAFRLMARYLRSLERSA